MRLLLAVLLLLPGLVAAQERGTPKLPPPRPVVGTPALVRPTLVRYGPAAITGPKRAEATYRPQGSAAEALVEVYELDPVPMFDDPLQDGNLVQIGTRTPYAVVYDDVPWEVEIGAVVWVAHDLEHLRRAHQAIPLPPEVYDAMLAQLGTTRLPLGGE